MNNKNSQPRSTDCDAEEIRAQLRSLLAPLEQFLKAAREFCNDETVAHPPLPCVSCPNKDTPHEACKRLEAWLPGAYQGKLHGEITMGVNFDEVRAQKTPAGQDDEDETVKKRDHGAFQKFRMVEPLDAMEPYKACWDLLSHEQQEAVELYHGEGKGVGEIAEVLHRSPSSVSGRLKRARDMKNSHSEQMRRKELRLLRELHRHAKWYER